MDLTIKTKWLEALRSGKYVQTQGVLRTRRAGQRGYCCLGVLCDIVKPTGWVGDSLFEYRREERSDILPESLSRELKISPGFQDKLVSLNDSKGATFTEIADWIEENL